MTSSQRLLDKAEVLLNAPIVAICSAAGEAAVGIVRLSGSSNEVDAILAGLMGEAKAVSLEPRKMHLRTLRHPTSDVCLDRCLVVRFAAPRSYTGEEVIEFHLHGNPFVLEEVQSAVCLLGARLAEPGEFTRRAVHSGRMSLLQAEAVDALVRAGGRSGIDVAQRHLGGELPERIDSWRGGLLAVASALEALVDFPEEVEDDEIRDLIAGLAPLCAQMHDLVVTFRAGRRLVTGSSVVLRGPVNAGKSTLFNALLGHSRAIVSAQAGTTRDVVSETLSWQGLSVTLNDTAGVGTAADAIEEEGIERGGAAAQRADLVLAVRDARTLQPHQDSSRSLDNGCLWVASHADCISGPARDQLRSRGWLLSTPDDVAAIKAIRERIVELLRDEVRGDGLLLHTDRQQRALNAALLASQEARSLGDEEPVLAAMALRRAGEALEELAGRWSSDEVLDELFARFCIGK
jgi:tRNA modification GTPase